jgi:hypothetical protein
MANIYHLDDISREITKALEAKTSLKEVTNLHHAVHIRSGYALEALYDAIAETIVPG